MTTEQKMVAAWQEIDHEVTIYRYAKPEQGLKAVLPNGGIVNVTQGGVDTTVESNGEINKAIVLMIAALDEDIERMLVKKLIS